MAPQVLPQRFPSGGDAPAREGVQEGQPAAQAGQQRKLLRRHHQTGTGRVKPSLSSDH